MDELLTEIVSKLESDSNGLQSVYTEEEVNKAINFALIFAHNLCTQISDKYNNDDFINEAAVAYQCCKAIRQFIKID